MDPKISNVETDNNEYKFTLSGLNVSLANALRRVVLCDIPMVVFRTETYDNNLCKIEKNTTRLHNEILKQRLSCIPVHMNYDELELLPENYIMELSEKNDSDTMKFVTTENFKIRNKVSGVPLKDAEVKRIFPPNEKTQCYIDFVRLRPKISDTIPGEEIKLKAEFSIATAKTNSMFNAVSKCAYGNTIDVSKVNSEWEKRKEKLGKDESVEFHKKNFYLLDAQRYYVEDSFDFILESVGVYDNKDIIKMAARILYEKFDNFDKLVESGSVDILNSNTTISFCFDVKLDNEDYTLGKVLEYLLYIKYYEKEKKLSYCGFKKFHPHDTHSVIRLGFNEIADVSNVKTYLKNVCMDAKQIYKKLYDIL